MGGIGKSPLTTVDDSRLQVKQQNNQNGIGIEAAGSTSHWDLYVTNGIDLALILNGDLKGTFSNVNGAYVYPSDKRLKKISRLSSRCWTT